LVPPIIAYTLSSTTLELRAEQFLPGSEGGEGGSRVGEGGGREKGGEMTQTLYAHMNKSKKNKAFCSDSFNLPIQGVTDERNY
jgi:hypothetical protein